MDTDRLLIKLNALNADSAEFEYNPSGSELETPAEFDSSSASNSELHTPYIDLDGSVLMTPWTEPMTPWTEPTTPFCELDASIADLSELTDHYFNSEFLNLPEEVLICVLAHCERRSVLALLCVCELLNSNSEHYFKRLVKVTHGKHNNISIFENITWRWLYDSKELVSEDKQATFSGVGKKKLFRNDIYEGEFVNGLCHGKGTYYWSRGDKYIGEWKNGYQDGTGVLIWQGGNKYEGGWKNGLRHGNGVYSWEVKGFNFHDGVSRDTFEGTWNYGVRQGQGKYKWANGNVCEGVWLVDVRSGGHFYEKLTDRTFYAPNVDSSDAEINLDLVSSSVREAHKNLRCTYSVTGTEYFFQYLWETTHEMPYNGVCITCKETCVERNQIDLSQPVKFIFGGKFVCPCGAGFYKHPCRAMGLYDPQLEFEKR